MKEHKLEEWANRINEGVKRYFQTHPLVTEAKPAELMPPLVELGVFKKDHRDGLPLRNILRDLDYANKLHLIPMLRYERKKINTSWFFTTGRHFSN